MPQKTRNELKELFKTGAKPSGDDFKAFIDSTLNVSDDGIAKATGADTPLKINAQGTDEKLLDFYTGETKTWSINQKPSEETSGLNIATPGGSKLFIDSSSGNVGIGTTEPTAKLEVSGDLKLQSGVAVNQFSTDGTLASNSDLAIPTEKAVKTYADTKALLNGGSNQDFSTKDLTTYGTTGLTVQAGALNFDASSTRQMINLWGTSSFYGIGVQYHTTYFRTHYHFAWYKGGIHNDTSLNPGTGGTVQMVIKNNGNVGIGTINPSKGKLQIEGSTSYTHPDGYRYLHRSGGVLNNDGTFNAPYSIYANKFIGCAELNVFSDLRIKEVKGVSDSKSDLNVLRQISVTDYTYKDKIANDDKPRKKVIGQQVAEVFPQAVKTHTDVVPDIFQSASITNGWVNLCDYELQVGERVKLILEDSEPQIYTIEAVTPEGFQVSLDHEGEVFVYGREVNDFHVVDYEALSMLNISATQELCKIIDALKIEVQQLKGSDHPMAAFTNS